MNVWVARLSPSERHDDDCLWEICDYDDEEIFLHFK